MDDYLSKPVPLNELQSMLHRWLPGVAAPADASRPAMPVDTGVLRALVGDDPAVLRGLLHDFRATAAAMVAELRDAVAAGQPGAAGTVAHKLKSSARAVGAVTLGELCEAVEQAGRTGDLSAVSPLLAGIEEEFVAVNTQLGLLEDAGAV